MQSLPIKENHVKGDVLVIGQGVMFAERVLLFTPPHLRQFRSTITSVTTCDTYYPPYPASHFDHSVISESYHIDKAEPGTIKNVLCLGSEFLEHIPPESFHTVMMFRIPHIYWQFQEDTILSQIYTALKRNGVFIGSGCCFPKYGSWEIGQFRFISSQQLPNPSQGYPFCDPHIGFILEKT